MINPGTYRARAMGSTAPHVQWGIASTGTEQVAVTFMLLQETSDDHNQPTGEYEPTGEEVTWIGSFTDKTQQRTLESLMHAGWAGVDIGDLSGLGSVDVDLVIEHEEDQNGRARVRVQWVNKAGGSRFKFKEEMPAGNFDQLRKRMKGLALSLKGNAPRPAASSTPAQRPPQGQQRSQGGGYRPPANRAAPPPGSYDDAAHDGRDPRSGQHADDIPF